MIIVKNMEPSIQKSKRVKISFALMLLNITVLVLGLLQNKLAKLRPSRRLHPKKSALQEVYVFII
jgi:hypothetical protein